MFNPSIHLDSPNVGEEEKTYLNQAIDTGFVSTIGPFVTQFESDFSRIIGAPSVSTQSGTAAIHVALHELGIGPGDEVIVPVLTFIASVNPIRYVGATPVFVDIDPTTWLIDPEKIKLAITSKTKAIIPVHLYGNPCDMTAILEIANQHKLAVIEDATESLGALYKNQHTGTFGTFGCFSFNGNKTITTGGGGMVVGKNTSQMAHLKFLVNQARDEEKGYYHPEVGFNYRMTNLEAAVGLAQLEKLEKFLALKQTFYQHYKDALDVPFQESYSDAKHARWLTCIQVSNIENVQSKLREKGIPSRRLFMPIVDFPPYSEDRSRFPNALKVFNEGLCLPSSTLNTPETILKVAKTIRNCLT